MIPEINLVHPQAHTCPHARVCPHIANLHACENAKGGCRDIALAVFCRGPGFRSYHPPGSSKLNAISVLKDPALLFLALWALGTHALHIPMYKQNTHTHEMKIFLI